MRFNNFIYKNKYVNFENQSIHIDKIGLYIVQGANGVGKSSVIKQIVFGINNVETNSLEQREAYNKNRKDLLAYVPQNICCPDISVIDYITKDDKSISQSDIRNYMEKFGLENISLTQNAKKLSGGEITKLCIISAILKDTPYIVLDEPSNNLDDTSVNMLCDIIEELRLTKTLVIITHDPRLSFDNYISIYFNEGKIEEKNNIGKINTNNIKNGNRVPKSKIGIKLQLTFSNILVFLLMFVLIFGMIFYNQTELIANYAELSGANTPPQKNTIMAYQASNVYDELNQIYTTSVGIEVSEDNYYNMIKYSDVSEISKLAGVKTVYIYDFLRGESLFEMLREGDYLDIGISSVSIPSIIYCDYLEVTGLQDVFALEAGRYPKDNKNEIVLSESIIKKLFNTHSCKDMLNQNITFEGKKYTLVGIGIQDMAWISYCGESNSLFYEYKEYTYDEFCNAIIKEKTYQEYGKIVEPENVFLITRDGYEKVVLDALIRKFPANNYSSNIFTIKWVEQYNKPIFCRLLIVDMIVAVLLSFVIIYMLKNIIESDITKILDYEYYYICNKSIRSSYIIFKAVLLVVMGGISFLINELFCGAYLESRQILFLPITIIIVSTVGYLFVKVKKEVDK